MQQLPINVIQLFQSMAVSNVQFVETIPFTPEFQANQFDTSTPWPLFAWAQFTTGAHPAPVVNSSPEVMFNLYNNSNFSLPENSFWNKYIMAGHSWNLPTASPDFSTAATATSSKDRRNAFMKRVNWVFAVTANMLPDYLAPAGNCYKLVMWYQDEDPATGLPAEANAKEWWLEIPLPHGHYMAVQAWPETQTQNYVQFMFKYDAHFHSPDHCIVTELVQLHPQHILWLKKIAEKKGFAPVVESSTSDDDSDSQLEVITGSSDGDTGSSAEETSSDEASDSDSDSGSDSDSSSGTGSN